MFCKIVRTTLNEDVLLCRVTPLGSATPHEKTSTPLMHPDESSFRSPYMTYGYYLRSGDQRCFKTYLGPLGADEEHWFVSPVKVTKDTNMRTLYTKTSSGGANLMSIEVDGTMYYQCDPRYDYDSEFHPMTENIGKEYYSVFDSLGFECRINQIGSVVEDYLKATHSIQRGVANATSFKNFITFLYGVPQTIQAFVEYLKTVESSLILPYESEGVRQLVSKFISVVGKNKQQLTKYLQSYGLKPLEMYSLAALADRKALKTSFISANAYYMLYDYAVSSNLFSGEVWPGFAAPGIDKAALQTGMLCSAIELASRLEEANQAVANGEYPDLSTAKKALGIKETVESTSASTQDGLKATQGTWTVSQIQDAMTIYALKALCNEPVPDNRDVVIINCGTEVIYLNKDSVTRAIQPGNRMVSSYPCIVFSGDADKQKPITKSSLYKVDDTFFNPDPANVKELRNNTLKPMTIGKKVYDAMEIAYVSGPITVTMDNITDTIELTEDSDITSFEKFKGCGVTKEDCMKLITEAW